MQHTIGKCFDGVNAEKKRHSLKIDNSKLSGDFKPEGSLSASSKGLL